MLNAMHTSLDSFTPKVLSVDPRGLAVRMIDYHRAQTGSPAMSRVTRQKHDWHGRLSASIDPRLGRQAESDPAVKDNFCSHFSLSSATVFSESVDAGWRLILFNEAGESIVSWDSRGNFRQLTHDTMNRLVAMTETMPNQPSAVVERLSYGHSDGESANRNQCGRLIRHDDTVGSEFTSEFGMLGAPLVQARRFTDSVLSPDWPLDEEERETLLEQQRFITRWDLSALGETLRQIDSRQNIQRNIFDLTGNLKQAHLQINSAIEKPVVEFIGYNADNRIVREVAGNGVITTCEYDDCSGRLVHLHCAANVQRPLQSLRYAYDPVGNVVEINDEVTAPVYFRNQRVDHRCTYGYDSLYQLIWSTGFEALNARDSAQVANFREDYEYDEAGNLHTLVHAGGNQYTRRMVTATYSNRSLAVYDDDAPGEPEITAGFDPNGNSQALLRGQVLEWDGRNQLQRVTPVFRSDEEDDSEVYGYDSQGQRLRKSNTRLSKFGSVIREVRYLPGIELHTDSNTGKAHQRVMLVAGLTRVSVMHWESEPPSGMESEHWGYSLSNHQGSSTFVLSETAQVLSQECYLPYGGTAWWVDNGSAHSSYKTIRYSGKERDASGLYYYGLRYYAHWLQRWISPDPAGVIDGPNLYRFVRNNPVTLLDTNGLAPVSLLYGFEHARTRVLPNLVAASPQQRFVRIDEINDALQINMENAAKDFEGLNEMVRDGVEIDDDNIDYFLKTTPSYGAARGDAKKILQGWSDYLKTHSAAFDIKRKLQTYENTNEKDVSQFWKKNLRESVSEQEVQDFTAVLRKDPGQLFSQRDTSSIRAGDAVINWQFRQFSKLALDWATSTADLGEEAGVVFLDIVARSPHFVFKEFSESVFMAKSYKESGAKLGKSFNPITHSERRHLQRNTLTLDSNYAKRVRFVNLAQIRKMENN
ncbi:RHS repeat domain-containing protein [Pseudomonas sp. BF-R-01]|jgi:insecticidal toxin complex protein TccC|uniref:RHS repeat domain-containing protein n=1 Tax=Pseudomonas sp. BF-R-01 TaxID=2832365 RepID=UPI001CBB4F7A|nr:RHS repeat-associated core domain-containing protein [Pseudomonas sp. BF-R-01]